MLIVSLIALQVVVFIILIFVFRRIMTVNVVSASKHLEELSQDYDKKQKEIDDGLGEAKRKAHEIISSAQNDAEKQKEQIIKEAQAERDAIISQARAQSNDLIQQADKSRQLLISEIDERIAKVAIEKACELIKDVLPEKFKEDAHSYWVEELIRDGLDHLEHLNISDEVREIKVMSAFPLNETQRKILLMKFRDIFKREITVKEETDPGVVGGLIVNIGDLVLDGSLKGKIQERAKKIHSQDVSLP
jgi:F0F1-type ATP synthase membrane subunit b/b'